MKPSSAIRASLLIALLLVCQAARADVVELAEFSIEVPEDWIAIPPALMDEHNANLEQPTGLPTQTYEYGFQLDDTEYWLQTPYLLVQIKNTGRATEKQLRAMPLCS